VLPSSASRDGRTALRDAKLAGVRQGQGEIADCPAAQDRGPQQHQESEFEQTPEQASLSTHGAQASALTRRHSAASRPRSCGADPLGRIDSQRPVAHRSSGWLPSPRLTGRIAILLPRGIPRPRGRHYAAN
jgi:hypothetical protein